MSEGRVRYISDPKRQENLYATFTNVESKYWSLPFKRRSEGFQKKRYRGQMH